MLSDLEFNWGNVTIPKWFYVFFFFISIISLHTIFDFLYFKIWQFPKRENFQND